MVLISLADTTNSLAIVPRLEAQKLKVINLINVLNRAIPIHFLFTINVILIFYFKYLRYSLTVIH
jgi:hypothetical protein